MNQDTSQHVRPLNRYFNRAVDEAQRLLEHYDTETSNTLAGIDLPATADALARLIESVLHSVDSRVKLLRRISDMYAGRAANLESIYQEELQRRETARKNCQALPRGSLPRIIGLTGFSYLGTLAVGAVLGGLMDEAIIAGVRLPIARNIARQVAATAQHLARKMDLGSAEASAFIRHITAEATAWHPQALYDTTMFLSLGLTCGVSLLQTHAQFAAEATAAKAAKPGFILADIGVGVGLYFLRSPTLASFSPLAFAVALFDASILITALFASSLVGTAVRKERELRRTYLDTLNAQKLAEQDLASTDAEMSLAIQKAHEFAAAHDHLVAQTLMRHDSVADLLKADVRHALNVSKVQDEAKNDAQILQLFKREASSGTK